MIEDNENLEDLELVNYTIDWEPKEDITSYELARAVPVLVSGVSGDKARLKEWIEDLPEEVGRHFVVEKNQ